MPNRNTVMTKKASKNSKPIKSKKLNKEERLEKFVKIAKIIDENPGISDNKVCNQVGLSRTTFLLYLDKLANGELTELEEIPKSLLDRALHPNKNEIENIEEMKEIKENEIFSEPTANHHNSHPNTNSTSRPKIYTDVPAGEMSPADLINLANQKMIERQNQFNEDKRQILKMGGNQIIPPDGGSLAPLEPREEMVRVGPKIALIEQYKQR